MRRVTRYEVGQLATTAALLILVGVTMFDIFGERSFGAWSVLAYLFYPLIGFLSVLAVWRNWRGMLDEQVAREQDRARQAKLPLLSGARKVAYHVAAHQQVDDVYVGTVVSFYLVGVVLYLAGYLR